MLKKLIFLFSSAYVLNIIASVQTKQPWHYQSHQNRKHNQIFFNGINSPAEIPPVQTPVVTSKKIDVAINQEVKPIYWSTLLPIPGETFSGHDNSLFEKDLDILIYPTSKQTSGDFSFSITLPAGNTNDVITAAAAHDCKDKSKFQLNKYKEENIITPQLKFNNKELVKQNHRKGQHQNRNVKKQNKKKANKHVVKDEGNVSGIKYRQTFFSDPNIKKNKKRNGQATQNTYRNNNKSSQPCSCQCHKTKEPKDGEYLTGKLRQIEEKITNFDERCINLDDVLNINLEYADHDCQCIRNSRNNVNTNSSRQKITTPNNFPIDYLNWIYNLVPYQQFGYYLQDNNLNFPYNLEALYKLSQEQGKIKKGSKNKKTKSPEKSSNRKRSHIKSSKKSRDKTNISDCDTHMELDPTNVEIKVFKEVSPNEALIGKYTSIINSEDDSSFNEKPKSRPDKNMANSIINYITPKILGILPKMLENLPKINEENHEDMEITSKVDNENQNTVDIIPEKIETEPEILQIQPNSFEILPETTEKCPEINEIVETADNIELMNKFSYKDHEIDTPSVLSEHYNSKNEGFVIPLLPHDTCLWDDYYPDFTDDNGAYITSSEEEEWFNFHNQNFYFNDEIINKDILKRNLNRKVRPNFEKTMHSPNCPYMNKFIPTRTKEAQTSSTHLEYPDFITRIINKEEIPSYIDILKDKSTATSKNYPSHNIYKVQDIETIYAPSKVVNYSVLPPYEDLPADEKQSSNKLYVREGDITLVYSTPFVTEYI